jgi:hypothetical protein
MKLLGVRVARSIWLIPQYFLNPKGVFLRPAVEALKSRYNFLKGPLDKPVNAPNEDDKFEDGSFSGKNGTVLITTVTLHNDGIVVDTRSSTDDGDAFLEDALTWISKEYGLPSHTEMPIKKIYASELNVVFNKTPKILDANLSPFLREASSIVGDERTGKLDFTVFHLGTDPALSERQLIFKFEREISTSFEQNRYYSYAPIKTEAHLRLLEKLEEVT